jgi:hypothetical protein
MDLRMKLMLFLFSVLLLMIVTSYLLTGEIFAVWFVVVLVLLFILFFTLRIAQKQRKI